jgi:hypothetical protein
MIPTNDLHWLAGLLEGEAYFGTKAANCQVAVDMTDPEPISKVANLLGVSILGPYASKHPNHAPRYRCVASGSKGVGWMMTLYGLLSRRRQLQIETALTKWKNHKRIFGSLNATRAMVAARKAKAWSEAGDSASYLCRSCGGTRGTKPLESCREPKHAAYYGGNSTAWRLHI